MMKNVHIGWGPVGMTKISSNKKNKLKLNANKVSLELGDVFKIIILSDYEELPQWSSSNEKVAKVDQEGNVTVVDYGVAYIIVTSGELKGTCIVTVSKPDLPDEPDEPIVPDTVPVTGVILNRTSLELVLGESAKLIATVLPTNATNKAIIWKSSNEAIAKVNNGLVTSISEGVTTISAITKDGNFAAMCEVYVSDPSTPIDKLDSTKIYYGTIQAPLITSFSELSVEDVVRAVESGTLQNTDLDVLETEITVQNQGDLAVILIPSEEYVAGIVEINGSKHEFDETVTGLNFCANGEIKLGNFQIFGKWMFSPGLLKIYVE